MLNQEDRICLSDTARQRVWEWEKNQPITNNVLSFLSSKKLQIENYQSQSTSMTFWTACEANTEVFASHVVQKVMLVGCDW